MKASGLKLALGLGLHCKLFFVSWPLGTVEAAATR